MDKHNPLLITFHQHFRNELTVELLNAVECCKSWSSYSERTHNFTNIEWQFTSTGWVQFVVSFVSVQWPRKPWTLLNTNANCITVMSKCNTMVTDYRNDEMTNLDIHGNVDTYQPVYWQRLLFILHMMSGAQLFITKSNIRISSPIDFYLSMKTVTSSSVHPSQWLDYCQWEAEWLKNAFY